ncbi:MAG: energy transducer TonB [Saprospiraceae bacterium]|nr:energy transducer TonB [Saprospiraceae bacterium]
MLKTLPLLLSLLLSTSLLAQWQWYAEETDSYTGKKGLVDQLDGTVYIPLEYDAIAIWPEDSLVTVTQGGKKGIFTIQGQRILPTEYEAIDLSGKMGGQLGLYGIQKGHRWGMANRAGKQVLPFEYEGVMALTPDLLIGRTSGNQYHFFDGKGNHLFTEQCSEVRAGFDDYTVEIIREDKSRYFVDKVGRPVFPDRVVDGRWTDHNSLILCATLKPPHGTPVPGAAGLLTWEGDTILPCVYDLITPQAGKRFLVKKGGESGLTDGKGKFLIPLEKGSLEALGKQPGDMFRRGISSLVQNIYDANGKLLADSCYVYRDRPAEAFLGKLPQQRPDRYYSIRRGNDQSVAFFRADGRQITPFEYKEFTYCSDLHPVLALKDGLRTAFDLNGKKLLSGSFSYLGFTKDPKVLIGKRANEDGYGFIHLDRPDAAKFEYETIAPCKAFYFAVIKGGKYYLHDPSGKPLSLEGFASIGTTGREDHEAFRQQHKGKLVARGRRNFDTDNWVAFDEKGKAWDMAPLPDEAPEFVEQEVVPAPMAVMEEMAKPVPVPPAPPSDDKVHDWVRGMPQFPGSGGPAMIRFISENKQYPASAKEKGIEGTVVVTFIVEKDGSLTDVKLEKSISQDLDEEALRLVKSMPKWVPGRTIENVVVRVRYRLPVEFSLK